LAHLDPSETNKFLPFLIKQVNKRLKEREEMVKEYNMHSMFEQWKATDFMQLSMMRLFTESGFFENEDFHTIKLFNDLLEKNHIEKTDISQYETFQEMRKEINSALVKYEYKNREKGAIILLDTEDYLAIKPLTYEASIKYGYNTKWCTASTQRSQYWNDYSRQGILTYLINKKTNDKLAIFMTIGWEGIIKETSFWNAADTRIDSSESGFDLTMIQTLLKELKTDVRSNHVLAIALGVATEDTESHPMNAEDPNPEPALANPVAAIAQLADEAEVMGGFSYEETDEGSDTRGEEIFIGERSETIPSPEGAKTSKIRLFINKLKRLFQRKKNIIVMTSNTWMDERQASELIKRFKRSSFSKTHEMVIFSDLASLNFNQIDCAVNGQSVPAGSENCG
jgi:hypothetical protein